MCLKIYHLVYLNFVSAPGLAWQAASKKTEIKKLELLTDTGMLVMVEKAIINMKDYNKNKASSYLKYWDANNLYGWAVSQKHPVNNFEWIEDTSQFNEDFIKSYNEESDRWYFCELDVLKISWAS